MKLRLLFIVKIITSFFLIALLAASIYMFVNSDIFAVKRIYITASPEIFTDTSMLTPKKNIFFIDKRQLQNNIVLANSWIKSTNIHRQLPHTLNIDVEVRKPTVLATGKNQTALIDSEGKLLPVLESMIGKSYPLLKCRSLNIDESGILQNKTLVLGLEIIAGLDKDITKPLDLTCEDPDDYSIGFEKTRAIYSPDMTAADTITSLLFLFKQFRIEGKFPKKIDLRFDKPVLKMEEVPQATQDSPSVDKM